MIHLPKPLPATRIVRKCFSHELRKATVPVSNFAGEDRLELVALAKAKLKGLAYARRQLDPPLPCGHAGFTTVAASRCARLAPFTALSTARRRQDALRVATEKRATVAQSSATTPLANLLDVSSRSVRQLHRSRNRTLEKGGAGAGVKPGTNASMFSGFSGEPLEVFEHGGDERTAPCILGRAGSAAERGRAIAGLLGGFRLRFQWRWRRGELGFPAPRLALPQAFGGIDLRPR